MTDAASGLLTAATLDRFSSKTRDRLLETSLVLFNERGFERSPRPPLPNGPACSRIPVYHFRTAKHILLAHIELLQQVFEGTNLDADSTDAETIIAGIFASYDVIWDFRYILRDDFGAVLDADEPAPDHPLINDVLDTRTEGRIRHAGEHGLLEMEPAEMEDLSEIILVIGRYWLDFSGKKYPDTDNLEFVTASTSSPCSAPTCSRPSS